MNDLVQLYYKKKITDEINYLYRKRFELIKSMKEKNERFVTIDGVEAIFNKIIKDLEKIVEK